MNPPTGLHHVALTVVDLDASARWYRRVLGLQEAFGERSEHRRAVVLGFGHGRADVGLVEHTSVDGAPFDPTVTGLDHVAFAVAERADLDGWAARLDGEGVAHSGIVEIPSGAILNFKDPDGIALSLFWDRLTN